MRDDTNAAWMTLSTISFNNPDGNYIEQFALDNGGTITMNVDTNDITLETTYTIEVSFVHT